MGWLPCTAVWPRKVARKLATFAARDPRHAARIVAAVDRYAATGYGDVRPLRGRPGSRLRVGAWRVLFTLDTQTHHLVVRAVALRRDAYRD